MIPADRSSVPAEPPGAADMTTWRERRRAGGTLSPIEQLPVEQLPVEQLPVEQLPGDQPVGTKPGRGPRAALALALLLVLGSSLAAAQQLPCRPCAGLRVDDPAQLLTRLSEGPRLEETSRFHVVWEVGGSEGEGEIATRVDESGAIPWPVMRFTTPSPVLTNLTALDAELALLARVAAGVGDRGHIQIDWRPAGGGDEPPASDYAFLIKRAAVTVTGANRAARVIVGPLPNDPAFLTALYAEDIAAYVDGIALAPAASDARDGAIELLTQLDPGRPVVLDSLEVPAAGDLVLARAAEASAAGFAVALFDATNDERAATRALGPLTLLAREFAGDLSLDPYSEPRGGAAAWSFVRGEDLSLQVLVEVEPEIDEVTLRFDESRLKKPRRVLVDGEEIPLLVGRGADGALELTIADPDPVTLLKLNRLTAAEIEGIAGLDEAVTVASARDMPVAEILRRHQAFQDAQERKLHTYSAQNTLSLRLQATAGSRGFDITFQGDYFFTQGEGYDWAWQRFFVNGVDWRNQRVPQIPLLQPEKASAAPAQITLTKEYSYRLRGTDEVDGRDCWVVDFEPAVPVTDDKSLYQGTVWIDREIYARVKSRTVQLGLRGDVTSNEETIHFQPIDVEGEPAAWSTESFVLPLHTIGQQVFSILTNSLVVERELRLENVRINPKDFDSRRAEVLASSATMLRDTDEGLRYLVVDEETGERVVQETPDPTRLFLVGGVFYDESLDYPLPLAGVNWLSFDFKGTGAQANVFFAGLLALVNIADPSLGGSRWEAGLDLFVLGVAGTDTLYVDGQEVSAADVERMRPNLDVTVGRNLGNFFKAQLAYRLTWDSFDRASTTSPDFEIPSDHLSHRFRLRLNYNRKGYRLRLHGAYTHRDEWDAWGLPDNPDYDPDKQDYTTWGGGVAKTWFFERFMQLGAEVEYVDGDRLDRFSKYGFGPFSDTTIRGYGSGRTRAEKAMLAHLSYGFNMGELFQLSLRGDAAWATDEVSGLDNELLAGIGISGTVVGPWRTIINLDVGKAIAGPDDGYTAFIAFLKLFS